MEIAAIAGVILPIVMVIFFITVLCIDHRISTTNKLLKKILAELQKGET